jgi:hypothetical protein
VEPSYANNCDETSVLPIELLSFGPEIKSGHVVLNWTTGTENNNDFFQSKALTFFTYDTTKKDFRG